MNSHRCEMGIYFRYFYLFIFFVSLGADARLRTKIDQIQCEMRICSCLVFIFIVSICLRCSVRACLVMFPHIPTYCKYTDTNTQTHIHRHTSKPAPIDLTWLDWSYIFHCILFGLGCKTRKLNAIEGDFAAFFGHSGIVFVQRCEFTGVSFAHRTSTVFHCMHANCVIRIAFLLRN